MKFTQDQKARFISNVMKTIAVTGFAALLAVIAYNLSIAESRGRERALLY